jgi:hypothetical protein
VLEFMTAKGEALAISIPRPVAPVIWHFQSVCRTGYRAGGRSASKSRRRCSPALTSCSNEKARVHHASRRRGGNVAARGSRAHSSRQCR